MTIALIILAIIFSILSGFCKAICDLSEEGKIKFRNTLFWLKDLSWRNKWKNGDKREGEKFKFSSTIFVLFTDAWHLFGFLFRLSFIIAYISVGYLISINIWYSFGALVAYIIFASSFHLFYNSKKLRK